MIIPNCVRQVRRRHSFGASLLKGFEDAVTLGRATYLRGFAKIVQRHVALSNWRAFSASSTSRPRTWRVTAPPWRFIMAIVSAATWEVASAEDIS